MKRTPIVACLGLFAAASALFASNMWSWVLNFDPGFTFAHAPIPTGSPLSTGVTILLVDGLRLDASRRMPSLNALRARGADIEALVGTPSFSRPGRATLVVGAPPSIHGVTTNRQKRALAIDNLIRRVGASSGTCRIAGSKIWSGLFGDDIARCGQYREDEAKEGPGAFVRQVPGVRASQESGLAFVLEQKATLRIADVISTDFAAHEYGGTSAEYRTEVQGTDDALARLVNKLDLSRETLVITADHGHRDAGGHGGEEPEVLAVPIVMVGAGIKPATTLRALQADIAPTVAVLLGLEIPVASAGSPMQSIMLADEAKATAVGSAALAQREAFRRAVAARFGGTVAPGSPSTWEEAVEASREVEGRRRLKIAGVLGVLVLAIVGAVIGRARPSLNGLLAGATAAFLLILGPVGSRLPVMSFSAINYDEMLVPFFVRIISLAVITAITGIAMSFLAGRFLEKGPDRSAPSVDAGALGLAGATTLSLGVLWWWWRYLLLEPTSLPGPDRLVEGFALTLGVLSVAGTSLLVMAILYAVERGRPRTGGTRA